MPMTTMLSLHGTTMTKSESLVQDEVRLRAAEMGISLWRNNVGVLKDERGRPIRYGLANESKKMNQSIKSADLIGIKPVLITPNMVGCMIGQFISLECKPGDWKYRGTDHEIAQAQWVKIINDAGGYAKFITGADQI